MLRAWHTTEKTRTFFGGVNTFPQGEGIVDDVTWLARALVCAAWCLGCWNRRAGHWRKALQESLQRLRVRWSSPTTWRRMDVWKTKKSISQRWIHASNIGHQILYFDSLYAMFGAQSNMFAIYKGLNVTIRFMALDVTGKIHKEIKYKL